MATNNLNFEIKTVPGKGKGMVASQLLNVGEVVVREDPLLVVDSPGNIAQMLREFAKMSDVDKEKFLDLYSYPSYERMLDFASSLVYTDREKNIFNIFNTNCITVCAHDDFKINQSAVYKNISRINHSCAPNVVWSWVGIEDPHKITKEVRVLRQIDQGQEIIVSYIGIADFFPRREHRLTMLRTKWRFICNCSVCSLSGDDLKRNEIVRGLIEKLHGEIPFLISSGNANDALKSAEKVVELMTKHQDQYAMNTPSALMECYELATYTRKPARERNSFKNQAKTMAEQFGDCFIYNYMNKMRKVEQNRNLYD